MVALARLLLIFILVACRSEDLKRPIGWLKVGPVKELQYGENYFPEVRVAVFLDENGLAAMSTVCTYDLSPLIKKGGRWESTFTQSAYDARGVVLHGPAKANLPFYDLRFDSETYGGPVNTLYVQVGVERAQSWRLPLRAPQQADSQKEAERGE